MKTSSNADMTHVKAKLPLFGRSVSRLASVFGAKPLAFASAKQSEWIASADFALSAMDKGGASLAGFEFTAYDERPFFFNAEKMLSLLDSSQELPPANGSSAAYSLSFSKNGQNYYTGMSVQSEKSNTPMEALSAVLGSANLARAFVVAHEWGHAYQASRGHFFSERAASFGDGPLASEFLCELRKSRIQLGLGLRSLELPGRSKPHGRAALMCEEAFCDAVGCWFLARVGCTDPVGKIGAFRKAGFRIFGDAIHASHFQLNAFFPQGTVDPIEPFSEFTKRALCHAALGASVVFSAVPTSKSLESKTQSTRSGA